MKLPGTWELIIILVIVIAIFGAGKLGSLGGAIGRGVKDFRSAVKPDDKAKDETADKGAQAEKDETES